MHRRVKLSAVAIITIVGLLSIIVIVQTMENPVQARTIRVACVGDSITEGSGYPSKLRTLLGGNYSVENFGVSGSTVSLSSDKPYIKQDQFEKARKYQPDYVVIMLGTNDARPDLQQYNETFDDDYTQLISSFQELNSSPIIWVVKSPPIQNNSLDLSAQFFNDNVIPQIEHVANNLALPTIDVYSAFSNHSDYFMDGVHPNDEGATLIASTVYDSITSQDYPFVEVVGSFDGNFG